MTRVTLDKKDVYGFCKLDMIVTPATEDTPTEVSFSSFGNYSSAVEYITVKRNGQAYVKWGETLYSYKGVDFYDVLEIVTETLSLGKAGNFIKKNSEPESKTVFAESGYTFSVFNEETFTYQEIRTTV
tara:strand:- start:368 stop:751 length:384 start_codon:yes stop_codon:yes gene_type:complete